MLEKPALESDCYGLALSFLSFIRQCHCHCDLQHNSSSFDTGKLKTDHPLLIQIQELLHKVNADQKEITFM